MFLYSLLSGATWYPILFDTPLNAVRSVFIWTTLALLVASAVCVLILKADKRKKFLQISLFVSVAYACAIGTVALVLSFREDGIQAILFVPLLVLLCAVGVSATILAFKRSKLLYILFGCIVGVALISVLICAGVHFASGTASENNGITNADVRSISLYVSSAIAVLILLLVAIFSDRGEKKGFDAKSIAYSAICIAMSFALSFMRIVRLPQGGSITPASLLPLMIYAYMFGVRKGIFTGFIYGLLQAFQDPWILHPAQLLLDYPVAFAWIGLAGLFSRVEKLRKLPQIQFTLGATLAGTGRFLMHFLSGTFAFGAFAPENTPVALYSLGYQAGYVLPDIGIAILVGIILFSSKAFVKETRKFHSLPLKESTTSAQ